MKRIAFQAVLSISILTVLLVSILSTFFATPAYAQGGDTYMVRPGDTLTYIAARHGLTATQLAAANSLNWNAWVYAGQKLRIPGPPSGTGASSGTAPSSETGTASGSSAASAAAPTGGTYVVQYGDSLSSISRRYGLTVDQLAAANGLRYNAWVYAGQRLQIPGQAAQTPAQPAPAPTTPAATTSSAYIVRPGDTLLRIAMRHGITVQRLAMANGMYVNAWVYIGQQLKIPASQPSPASSAPAAAPQPAPSPAAGDVYVVRPGDSLIGIAVRHGIGVSQLAAANGLQATAWVYVGQRLKMPGPNAPGQQPAPQPAAPQPTPSTPTSAAGVKWIDVNLTAQTLTAYAGDQVLLHTKVSTGTRYTPTVVGTYHIYSKYVSTHMSGPGYSVPNVPHAMFFYGGYSLHGTYWHNNFGTPMSHGCVNLPLTEAKWLFEWAPVGTKVVTHY